MLCKQHRLAGARRRDDQAALALPIGVIKVHDARRQVVRRRLELQPLLRIERRQVFEEQLVARLIRRLEVDRFDLDQREVALAVFRRTHLTGNGVPGLQVELANLRRRDVDVVRARQVVVVGRAQEAEAVRQHLEDTLGEHEAALLGLRFQNLEDQILLAHAGRAGHVQILGDLGELLNAHVLQVVDVQRLAGLPFAGASPLAGRCCLPAPSALGGRTVRSGGQRPEDRQADARRSASVDWP
jgi:hypothetical protein